MPIKLMLGATVVQSPAHLKDLINAAIRLAAALWAQYMRAYVAEHRHVSDGTRPRGKIPVATGNLEREILAMIDDVELVDLGATFNIGFESDEYKYVDAGRAPGSYPPLGAIDAWMRVKGMDPKRVWGVMTKLKKEGFKGYFFLSPLQWNGMRYMRLAIQEAFNRVNLDFYFTGTRREMEITVEGLA